MRYVLYLESVHLVGLNALMIANRITGRPTKLNTEFERTRETSDGSASVVRIGGGTNLTA